MIVAIADLGMEFAINAACGAPATVGSTAPASESEGMLPKSRGGALFAT
ncbi:MAG: hypothetical protein ACM3QY_15105 [Candidatus Levyibacteriota bacterium]